MENKPVLLVTGGAQGIGRAVAMDFASNGFRVVIFDLDQEAGEETLADLEKMGTEALFCHVDVADAENVREGFAAIISTFGRLDVLVSNAGISASFGTPVEDLPVEQFDHILNVNLRGTFLCAKYGIPLLKRNGGSIILIASTRALMSEAHTEAYSASKGGLVALAHALAVSLSGTGIRVNAISPGWIAVEEWQKASQRRVPTLTEQDHLQHPVGRVGKPEDIAVACRFLASDEAGFITGSNLVIDGGMTVKMIYNE